MRFPVLCLWVALASCDSAPPIDEGLQRRVEAAVAAVGAQGEPGRAQRLWMADRGRKQGLVCGRLDAANPLVVHETGRAFVYDDRTGKLQLEPAQPSRTSEAGDAFNALWTARCAPGDR